MKKNVLLAFLTILAIAFIATLGYQYKKAQDDKRAMADNTKAYEIAFDEAKATPSAIKQAIEFYTQAIALNPKFTWPLNNRGIMKMYLNDYFGAIEDFTAAINLDPAYVNAYVNRCDARGAAGDYKGALEDCEKALTLDPRHKDAAFTKALLLEHLARYEKALEVIDAAQVKTAELALLRGRVLAAMGMMEDAEATLEKAVRTYPDDKFLRNNLYFILAWRGKFDKACEIEKALENRDNCPNTQRLQAGQEELNKHPDDATAIWLASMHSYQSGNMAAAADYAQKAAAKDKTSKNWASLNALAIMQWKQGKFKEALDNADKAIDTAPGKEVYQPLDTRANILRDMGRYDDALAAHNESLDGAQERNPAELLYHRGLTKGAMGDLRGAQSDFDRACEILITHEKPQYGEYIIVYLDFYKFLERCAKRAWS